MRICLVTPTYPEGGTVSGVGTAVHTLAHGLINAGHQVVVVALSQSAESIQNDGHVLVHRVRQGQWHWYVHKIPAVGQIFSLPVREVENSLSLWRCVRRLHRQHPFDIIEGTETGSLFLGWPGERGCAVVVRLHGEEHTFRRHTAGMPVSYAQRLSRFLQRMALRRAHVLISPSCSHAHETARELKGRSPGITVIPHGVDPSWMESFIEPSQETLDLTVLYVGRMEMGKGIIDLLHAFAFVVRERPTVRLKIAGGSHPTVAPDRIERLVNELSLSHAVEFLGQLSYSQLSETYRKAQFLVFPSYYETFGLVALEAMACGLPVIAGRAGALPEIVVDGETGLLVTPGDPHELSQAILRLLGDSGLRQRMGQAGRQRAEKEFGVQKIMERTLAVYERLLATAHSDHGRNSSAH